ncbi:uncharacterized protein LOC142170339 [Nicotiana tabacum]|uniref:Uncharacterized protein LOC142170339 n=1 Tax=Nicotiana tabacum TaxID=4097 RepID=A0AC58STQ4_TOBAC
MKVDLENRFSLNVSDSKLKRVKRMVLEKLESSYLEEYNKLEAYAQELRETNIGTDVVIQISKDAMEEGKRRFLRCMSISKPSRVDSKQAIVDKETKTTWQRFMENLKASLDLKDGEGYTFMSDMQKGVLDVVRNVCPQSYHRYCARHIEANWSKKWNTDEMKKAYFDTQCKNPMVDNNFTESFNSWILEARHKPIVKMLEDIRVKVMNQLKYRAEEVNSWRGEYNPYAMEL